MTIARIADNTVAEERNLTLTDVPAHKREHWRTIEGEQPAYDASLETISGPTYTIEPTRALRVWTVTRRPRAEQIGAVKMECRARILARFPEWKQTNMVARATELQDIWRRLGVWTAAEKAEADAISAAWGWVKAVRVASDAIEAMPEVPADYRAPARWPA